MQNFLDEQKVKHKIFIINQVDQHRFNRASLINVGHLQSREDCDYLAMHDIDLLPLNPALKYSYPKAGPFHIASPDLHPRYHYRTFVGGILLLTREDFELVNGLSNKYWGWGLEDDEFYARMKKAEFNISRPRDIKTGQKNTFKHIHDKNKRKRDTARLYNQREATRWRDHQTGLNTVQYRVVSKHNLMIDEASVTVINVELVCNYTVTPWCDHKPVKSSKHRSMILTLPSHILKLLGIISYVHWPSQTDYFTAAVYEHVRLGDDDPLQIAIQKNIKIYTEVTGRAAAGGADIIVFPEYGLYSAKSIRQENRKILEHIPNPEKENWNPCVQKEEFKDRPILTKLSCAAKVNRIVLVANMGDLQPCQISQDPHCPPDGEYHYNTNVAFGRDGTLLARYHKMHLFFEIGYNIPSTPEYAIFNTDFGVMGMFTCFDILFEDAMKLVRDHGVQTVLFPTWWFDELPFLAAHQFQEAWSLGLGVNLVATNIHEPSLGSLGSGIYSGTQGALNYTHTPDGKPKLLFAQLPKNPNNWHSKNNIRSRPISRQNLNTSNLVFNTSTPSYHYEQTDLLNYTLSKLHKSSDRIVACNNGLCCTVEYDTNALKDNFYLAVFNGIRSVKDHYFWCEEVCLLTVCRSQENKQSSSFPTTTKTVFTKIKLSGNFSTSYVYPNVLTSGLYLQPLTKWTFSMSQQLKELVTMATLTDPVLSANLYGRCYDRDPIYRP
ncbi:pantetheinase-like isoform X2 [Tachypleus tridentatus]